MLSDLSISLYLVYSYKHVLTAILNTFVSYRETTHGALLVSNSKPFPVF